MYAGWSTAIWSDFNMLEEHCAQWVQYVQYVQYVRRALCTMSCKVWGRSRPLKFTAAIKSWSLGFSTLTVRPLVLKCPTTLLITQGNTAWLLIFFIFDFWQRQLQLDANIENLFNILIAAVCCGEDALAVCPQLLLHSHATWELLF